MLRPHECVVDFNATGLPLEQRQSDRYVWVRQGAKGGRERFIALNSARREAAIDQAKQVASWSRHAHLGDPSHDLRHNLKRFDYVLHKFGISVGQLGITAHGLRHEALIDEFVALTGVQPAVRGGGDLQREQEKAARLAVSRLAGHNREFAASAYLGAVMFRRRGGAPSLNRQADQTQPS